MELSKKEIEAGIEAVIINEREHYMEKSKSRQQEKSYHKLFQQIADHCVAHGITMEMCMALIAKYRPEVDAEFVKSTWRAILNTKTGKTSTKDQTKADVQNVQKDFEALWTEITKENIDWPSIEKQMLYDYYNKQ